MQQPSCHRHSPKNRCTLNPRASRAINQLANQSTNLSIDPIVVSIHTDCHYE